MIDLAERMKKNHYRNQDGFFVFTEKAHLERGSCCGSDCRHCPFEPRSRKGNQEISATVRPLVEVAG